ncbi:MerR family transcriptional regulator [Nonomuraea roseoviolacea]|uniref:DNA-binding transcriptional MerR regulator n=1 Tax=Nonomuraea roseoviolacea subsp. carminata TaxID=160689 RepID=A0ABT1JXI7_9ACTN|nr:MerR family transcriptional regulator [Nonomuraea roseoviolacea]MCP2346472.1 DNA-binding transcriptional MerR regulator [Nonomuraea roseoviolacea subsp. carminata]
MDGDACYSIGDLARRTGLTVKAIRFYSDQGIVPPIGRTPAGYRRYGVDAVARLDLVRTLRELGLDLPTVRRVVDREVALPEVAAAHADALAVQIRTLRLRRAVLTAVARRGSTPEEMELMHTLARLSEDERRRLVEDFLDAAFGGLGETDATGTAVGAFAGIRRSLTPELPDDPEPEQVEAWVELAELSGDPGFRAVMRRVAEEHAELAAGAGAGGVPRPHAVAVVREKAGPAVAAGLDPASEEAGAVLDAIVARCARITGLPGDARGGDDRLPRWLLAHLEAVNDPRRERYLRLLAVVNGWPPPESLTPPIDWTVRALRARTSGSPPAVR